MDNPAILPFIAERYSPIAFSNRHIGEDELKLLFEAAGRAPSSFNSQPWVFLYATSREPDLYGLFYDCLVPGNQKWVRTAPVIVLTIVRKSYERNDKPDHYAHYEAGMAVGNLLIQGMYMGIYVHQMGGYDKEMAKINLDIPDNYDPLTMMAVGYPGDISVLPDDLHERAAARTSRQAVDEIVFKGKLIIKENKELP